MKRLIFGSLLLLVIALLLPMLFIPAAGDGAPGGNGPALESGPPGAPSPAGDPSIVGRGAAPAAPEGLRPAGTPGPSPTAASAGEMKDADYHFTALIQGVLTETTLADYLPGVLAAEMPASFAPEALKAQAVAARTFILYRAGQQNSRHPEAAVCDDSTCCTAYTNLDDLRGKWGADWAANREKIIDAVQSTDGQYLVFDGAPILAAFHASSAGETEDSGAVWGALPYLIPVSSPETAADVPNYVSIAEVSANDFQSTVKSAYPGADLSGAPETWLGEAVPDASGRTGSVKIGGVSIEGTALRTMFGLRSTAFTLEYTGGHFLFTVTGSGHGLGLSQYGANVMAEGGADFREILAHYYPGTEMV
ncbi:MAG: stage II sporulation protein D [Firmicutes bacterium]|nr:stage II sporulation protein D [Bacillota bacterium]